MATGYAGADVREDQVVPAEQRHEPVGGREIDADLPLAGVDTLAAARDLQTAVGHRCVLVNELA